MAEEIEHPERPKVQIPQDMLAAVVATEQRCRAKLHEFTRALQEVPPPPKIYHYTDSAGLLGILESGKIRLTNIHGLNDPTELAHTVKHAGAILAAKAVSAHPAAQVFARQFSHVMDKHLQDVAHFFVACFSHDEDELSQWRAYADNGHGFAIGFAAKALEHSFSKGMTAGLNGTFPVTYDDGVLERICEGLADAVMPLIAMPAGRGLNPPTLDEYMKTLSVKFGVLVLDAALYFKHEAYKAEREYRFLHARPITHAMTDTKYRARRLGVVHFLEFDWKTADPTMLSDIVIGPAANQEAAREFIRHSLAIAKLDASKVSVRPSKIPYRS